MSARNFHSISMAAGVAAAALGCYMVSLRVAAERATLEQVETRIVLAQRDIRLLQTEVGTRGRLAQLEKWNVKVLALSAPDANQFLQGSYQLATLARPRDRVVDPAAPVVLASAPRPQRQAAPERSDSAQARPGLAPSDMMHVASYKPAEPAVVRAKAVEKPALKAAAPAPTVAKLVSAKAVTAPTKAKVTPVTVAKVAAAKPKPAVKPKPDIKPVDRLAAKPASKLAIKLTAAKAASASAVPATKVVKAAKTATAVKAKQ